MQSLRAAAVLTGFFALTLPLMPMQYLLLRSGRRWARALPHWYHRGVCRILGVRITVEGEIAPDRPVLLVSNHVSWLDIPVLSAVGPVSFVAKKDVDGWPFVRRLARLQRTIFVDRERRGAVHTTTQTIMGRLKAGDHIVLFAEGTSSDGNRVLPFRTSLFAAAKPSGGGDAALAEGIYVQTLALGYTRLHGLPLSRHHRHIVAWYGDMEMAGHVWSLLRRGPLDVHIRIGAPVALEHFADRKALARFTETQIRSHVASILCARDQDPASTDGEQARQGPASAARPVEAGPDPD